MDVPAVPINPSPKLPVLVSKVIPVTDLRHLQGAHVPPVLVAPTGLLADQLGRPLRDLRISVTDRCNFRCVYCMPKQVFDIPAQTAFARQLSYNPWHCIAEHRPLGNQSRARRHIYATLARMRQQMNGVPHYEPTGDEVFE